MATGIICSVLLFKKSRKKPANTLLALGILAFVWLNTKSLLHSFDVWKIHGIGFFPNSVELALPPLFYFYIKSLINTKSRFTKRELLHFAPFFISQTYSIIVYIAVMQTPLLAEKDSIANALYFNEIKSIDEYVTLVSTMIYLFFAFKHNQDYKRWLSTNTSDTQLSELRFLKTLALLFLLISFYSISNLILNEFLDPSSYNWRWKVSHLLIASVVYYMGLVGYKNSDVIPPEFTIKAPQKKSKLNEDADMDLIDRINTIIKRDKVYLNPKLSLQDLAQALEVNETALSNSINAHYKKNFRGFINDLRVKEVQDRLLEEGLGNLSLLGLAKECGFNSEASFYRIFRSTTGVTPKQFLAKHS